MHSPAHDCSKPGQSGTHDPALQTSSSKQGWSQAPQWLILSSVLTQRPSQTVCAGSAQLGSVSAPVLASPSASVRSAASMNSGLSSRQPTRPSTMDSAIRYACCGAIDVRASSHTHAKSAMVGSRERASTGPHHGDAAAIHDRLLAAVVASLRARHETLALGRSACESSCIARVETSDRPLVCRDLAVAPSLVRGNATPQPADTRVCEHPRAARSLWYRRRTWR